jgi:predicted butyrate kinase (DUF1464 family)
MILMVRHLIFCGHKAGVFGNETSMAGWLNSIAMDQNLIIILGSHTDFSKNMVYMPHAYN